MYTTMNLSDNKDRIEVITEVLRSRRWRVVEKLPLVQRTPELRYSVSLAVRRADIFTSPLFQWSKAYAEAIEN